MVPVQCWMHSSTLDHSSSKGKGVHRVQSGACQIHLEPEPCPGGRTPTNQPAHLLSGTRPTSPRKPSTTVPTAPWDASARPVVAGFLLSVFRPEFSLPCNLAQAWHCEPWSPQSSLRAQHSSRWPEMWQSQPSAKWINMEVNCSLQWTSLQWTFGVWVWRWIVVLDFVAEYFWFSNAFNLKLNIELEHKPW